MELIRFEPERMGRDLGRSGEKGIGLEPRRSDQDQVRRDWRCEEWEVDGGDPARGEKDWNGAAKIGPEKEGHRSESVGKGIDMKSCE